MMARNLLFQVRAPSASAAHFWGTHVATEHQDNDKNASEPGLSKRGAARRRLTRAGIAAGGVLATLNTRSAMASAGQCKTPSGWDSFKAAPNQNNSHYGDAGKCDGLSAAEWKNKSWPVPKDTKFCPTFYADTNVTCPTRKGDLHYLLTNTHYQASSYACCTFADLINGQTCDPNGIGAKFVAAYLNISSGRVTVMQTGDLVNMWRELQTTGTFSPTAGKSWSRMDVANYLDNNLNS